jgi:hypothetical protein
MTSYEGARQRKSITQTTQFPEMTASFSRVSDLYQLPVSEVL